MRSLWLISFVVFASVSGTARGESDCTAEVFNGSGCCNTDGLDTMHKKEIVDKCVRKYLGGHTPPSKNARACIIECIFDEEDLLDDVKKIDREAILKFTTPHDDALKQAILTIMKKCFDSYDAELDSSLECKSGAFELTNCLAREGFLNCHNKSYWTPSPACEELKANVTKCQKIPVILGATREIIFQ